MLSILFQATRLRQIIARTRILFEYSASIATVIGMHPERFSVAKDSSYNFTRTELEKIGGAYEDDPDQQRIYFKDPITNEYLQKGTPECITLEDPMCTRGIEWLQSNGKRINISLLLSSHGKEKDFTTILEHPNAHASLQASPFIAIEANFDHKTNQPILEDAQTGRGHFQQAQLRWLLDSEKKVLPCDIDFPLPPHEAGGHLRQVLYDIAMKSYPQEDNTSPQTAQVLNTLSGAYYHCIREHMMVGQLGYLLSTLDEQTMLPNSLDIPFIVGAFHLPLADIFATYTNKETAIHLVRQYQPAITFADVARQGYITYDQLQSMANK